MKARFKEIYANNEWLYGSGEGSLPAHTAGYSSFLESFIKKQEVSSVVDMGCGDWQFSKYIDWGAAEYLGLDIVHDLTEKNAREYSRKGVSFSLYSGDPEDLPSADLLIVKDVLQHLSNEKISNVLLNTDRYKYCLLTNCVNPEGRTDNQDVTDGDFRYLDLRLPPFNIEAKEVYSFENSMNFLQRHFSKPRWKKVVLLIDNST